MKEYCIQAEISFQKKVWVEAENYKNAIKFAKESVEDCHCLTNDTFILKEDYRNQDGSEGDL